MTGIVRMFRMACLGVFICVGGLGALPSPADAALVFGIKPATPKAEILQNKTLSMMFTATMSMASSAPDVKMYLDDTTLAGVSLVLNNASDGMDKIMYGSIVEGGTCFGFIGGKLNNRLIITPGNSCTFKMDFVTQDTRDPDPDKEAGDWTVTEKITGQGLNAASAKTNTTTENFSFNAIVLDVPEPSTWLLLLSGLGAVGAALRLARRNSLIAA